MKKRGKQNKHRSGGESQSASYKSSLGGTMSFGFKHMLLVLAIGIAIGGFVGYEVGRTHIAVSSGDLPTDAYGRTVGDLHYGHNHP